MFQQAMGKKNTSIIQTVQVMRCHIDVDPFR